MVDDRVSDHARIRSAVRKRYREVARTAEGCFRYPTGADGARALGYPEDAVQAAPAEMIRSFCGVGNPFSLGDVREHGAVLDVGCGAGFDLLVTARLAGGRERLAGIDMTHDMVVLAREVLVRAGLGEIEVRDGSSEAIPFDDGTFDLVISNGVLNLSPDKRRTFQEIHRVLRPGGRLQIADIVLDGERPREREGSPESWSD